ncbi:MAG: 30S ribosome-binding factor RbfA [Eggerthellaceae bacterium]|nr:30S ribosome-binding factor RbfA [Eggerthellaceae bacterium]
MKQTQGNRRAGEQARVALSNILLFDISDPRLHMVTITGCKVSLDRSHCTVYYTAAEGTYNKVAAGFEAAKPRLRSLLGQSLSWRVTPELHFVLDPTVDEAARIAQALQKEEKRREAASVDDKVKLINDNEDIE